MATKKTFTDSLAVEDLNPALQFISSTEAVTKPEPGKQQTRFVFNTPERETKSRRLQMLIKPSTYDRIKEKADAAGTSVNNYINALLEYYLENEG